jgi:hypothetical protein
MMSQWLSCGRETMAHQHQEAVMIVLARNASITHSLLQRMVFFFTASAVGVVLFLALLALIEVDPADQRVRSYETRLRSSDLPNVLLAPIQVGATQQPWSNVQLAVAPALPDPNALITITAAGIWRNTCIPRYQAHQVTANLIRINAVGEPFGAICGQAITPWKFAVAVGSLPVGAYRVELYIACCGDSAGTPYTTLFTVTPAPVAALIADAGGELSQRDTGQRITLIVPPRALITPTLFTITYQVAPTRTNHLLPIGHFFAITATQPNFTLLFTLTVRYSDSVRGPIMRDTEMLYQLQDGRWVTNGITITTRLTDGLIAQITQLSRFGLLGSSNHLYLPIIGE